MQCINWQHLVLQTELNQFFVKLLMEIKKDLLREDILERILVWYLMHCFTLNSNKNLGLLLLIDFEKAFDSISWDFLHEVLKKFNFGPSMQKWAHLFYNDI